MAATTVLMLVSVFSAITAAATEAVKKFLDGMGMKYPSNLVVLAVALTVGMAGTAVYYAGSGIPVTAHEAVCMGLMGIANWIGAMTGYDKVTQVVRQIKGKG